MLELKPQAAEYKALRHIHIIARVADKTMPRDREVASAYHSLVILIGQRRPEAGVPALSSRERDRGYKPYTKYTTK